MSPFHAIVRTVCLSAWASLWACDPSSTDPHTAARAATATPAPVEAVAPTEDEDTGSAAAAEVEAAPDVLPTAAVRKPLPAGAPERIVARHLLVAHAGAVGAPKGVARSRDDARARAEALLARAHAGEGLGDLAREASDDSTRARGGYLGTFGQGAMQTDFEVAAFALKPGQISGVVETPFGFHLIERLALDEVHVAQILVQHQGSKRAPKNRTREDAWARAHEARALVVAGTPIAEVARTYSDGATALRGGDLGRFQRGQMYPVFEDAAFALADGEVSEVIESPLGFHVIQRLD